MPKNHHLLRSKPLVQGDLIGVVAPSSPFSKDAFEKGIQYLQAKGFRVHAPPAIFNSHRIFLAGSDTDRAGALMDMFVNPEVRAIMAVRGGYGSQRILQKLDARQIRNHPKIFLGYSDITFLLLYLLDSCGIIPFHGPMLIEIGDMAQGTEEQLFMALTREKPLGRIPLRNAVWIKQRRAKGALVGGNLTAICTTLGTPWEIKTKGRLLFLEECGEKPYKIDRMLNQLKIAGTLSAAKGLIFGDILEKDKDGNASTRHSYEKEVLEIVKDVTGDFQGPVLLGLPVGHGGHNITLPLGVEALLDGEQGDLTVTEPALEWRE